MKRGLLGAALAVALTATALSAPPAQAASGSLTVPTIIRYDSCENYPYWVRTSPDPGYDYDVSVEVDVFGPDGQRETGDFLTDFGTTAESSLFMCGSEMPGRWRMDAKVRACDYDYNCEEYSLTSRYFTVRKPHTRTSLSVKPARPRKGQVVHFRITTKDERRNGYYATSWAPVYLQEKKHGRWVRVHDSRTSAGETGRAVLRYRWTGGKATVRAVTPNSSSFSPSTSKPIVIKTKR